MAHLAMRHSVILLVIGTCQGAKVPVSMVFRDMKGLVRGLRLLNMADPNVEVSTFAKNCHLFVHNDPAVCTA